MFTYAYPPCNRRGSIPGTLLPVRVWSWSSNVAFVPSLPFLSGGTLDPRLSLCSFLSFSTTWSLGPSFPRAAQGSFGSISTRCPRGSWDTCHVCPHPGLSTIITRWTWLNRLQKRRKFNDKAWQNASSLGQICLPSSVSIQVRKYLLIISCFKRENVLSRYRSIIIPCQFLNAFWAFLNQPADRFSKINTWYVIPSFLYKLTSTVLKNV